MSIREDLLLWADQFENDHYVFEAYGDEYTVDLPRETVEAAIDIAIIAFAVEEERMLQLLQEMVAGF